MAMTPVTITHLEMTDPAAIVPGSRDDQPRAYVLAQCEIPTPGLNRFLYATVGAQWNWRERLSWSHARWMDYLGKPNVQTWIAWAQGSPAGYFELDRSDDGSVEIAYFGLLPWCIGKGIGSALLTDGLRTAWAFDASRVWLHTCTFDHPNAIANYQRRGLDVFKVEHNVVELPTQAPEPWPGCGPLPQVAVDPA